MSTELNQKHEAVLRKAAAAIRARGHEGDARLADSVEGIVASLACRASPAAAVPEGALPPLPKPWLDRLYEAQPEARGYPTGVKHEMGASYKDAEIAEWRARAAVEADRAQRPDLFAEIRWRLENILERRQTGPTEKDARECLRLLSEASADRAQQGEPVGECWRCIACNKPKAEIETECSLCGGSSFKVSNIATKAAAPEKAQAGEAGAAPAHPGEGKEGKEK